MKFFEIEECICGHISCICHFKKRHKKECLFLRAVSCSVGIECDHGFDVCPICDPCTCDHGGY